jgi:predicted RNA-binding protein YlqC (UPF0109 family)
MQELVASIAKALVDRPDAVRVARIEGARAVILELRVAPDDMGHVIGQGGRIANAIRTLARIVAARAGKRVTLEIV